MHLGVEHRMSYHALLTEKEERNIRIPCHGCRADFLQFKATTVDQQANLRFDVGAEVGAINDGLPLKVHQ